MQEKLVILTQDEYKALKSGKKELKCRLDIPREWYTDKLKELENTQPKTRNVYNLISLYRARLRYYDAHIEEATNLVSFNKDCMVLGFWKTIFKEQGSKRLWHDCCTIEKMIKEKGIEAWPVVQHALDVISKHYDKEHNYETI